MDSSLYPEIRNYSSGWLQVSAKHRIYFEESGNPEGQAVVFVHGGPGGGTSPYDRRYFDPKHYRIILFDQRGCGKSTPYADLEENTTWDLVSDMEQLRVHLKIERWMVFGGSWGSTLSLLYAETHPQAVVALILRGIFLCRKQEIDWFYQEGASRVFPEAWAKYLEVIPRSERGDMVAAYYRRLTSPNALLRLEAARAWSVWEGSTSYLDPNLEAIDHFGTDAFAEAFARIECHYFINRIFLKTDNYILDNVAKIRQIPTVVVHGRFDMVCPVENAWDLKMSFPEIDLKVIPRAGHSAKEPGILKELMHAMDRFKGLSK